MNDTLTRERHRAVRRYLLVNAASHCKRLGADWEGEPSCDESHGCTCSCVGCTAAKKGGAR